MAEVVRILLNEAMRVERAQALEASPYERSVKRRGYANGFKPKTVNTRLGRMRVAIPQVRGEVEFCPSALERGVRSERALKLAVAEMYVQGVSTRKITEVMQQLCGLEVSGTQVSRATQLPEEELSAWRDRLLGQYRVDVLYEKVRHGGTVISCAVLMAIGVNTDGHCSVLGCSVSLSEAEVHWREFLGSLQARGLHGVDLIISDHHAGLRAALTSRFASVPWQRCQFHLQRNAMAFVPRVEMRAEVAADLRALFDSPDRAEAERRLQLVVEKYRARAMRCVHNCSRGVLSGFDSIQEFDPQGSRLNLYSPSTSEIESSSQEQSSSGGATIQAIWAARGSDSETNET
jgi:putative transposase